MALISDNELLITTSHTVVKVCMDGSCPSEIIADAGYTEQFRGIAILPNKVDFLVVGYTSDWIYKCPVNPNVGDCKIWAHSNTPFPTEGHPWSLTLIAIHDNIVYIPDYLWYKMYAMTLNGVFLTALDIKMGAFDTPSALAIRPGLFAPLSSVSLPSTSLTAGQAVNLLLDLRDGLNQPITSPYPDPSRISVIAIGEIDVNGEMRTVEFELEVIANEQIDYLAVVNITSAGVFQVHMSENGNSFKNSPIALTVEPGATASEKTFASVPSTILEETTEFIVSIDPRDNYGNPTNHDGDVFVYFWADEDDKNDEGTKMIIEDRTATTINKISEVSERSER